MPLPAGPDTHISVDNLGPPPVTPLGNIYFPSSPTVQPWRVLDVEGAEFICEGTASVFANRRISFCGCSRDMTRATIREALFLKIISDCSSTGEWPNIPEPHSFLRWPFSDIYLTTKPWPYSSGLALSIFSRSGVGVGYRVQKISCEEPL